MNSPIIMVEGVSKRFRLDAEKVGFSDLFRGVARLIGRRRAQHPTIWALRNISFSVASGERIGIIGKNGAGKSTLLKIMSRVTYPTQGRVRIRGRVTSLLEVGTGFSDELTGRENIFLNASLHGLSRAETDERIEEIIDFSEIRRFVDTPIKHYSSGMRMRLAFSVAAHLDPDILILDEVLAVGDLSFQRKCLERMGELTSSGRTLLFVSHSMEAVNRFCERVIWLDLGEIVADGSAVQVTGEFMQRCMGLRASFSAQPPSHDSADLPPEDGPQSHPREGQAMPTDGANAPGIAAQRATSWPVEGEPAATAASAGNSAQRARPVARLISARILDGAGRNSVMVAVTEGVGIEIVFEVLVDDADVEPALLVKTAKEVAFAAAFVDAAFPLGCRRAGRYCATARIPPHFLNTGVYFVGISLNSPDPLVRHIMLDNVLSFHVHEPSDPQGTARGRYGRGFPGVVRPKLEWCTQLLPEYANTSARRQKRVTTKV
jgi:homopolymeric O-antigen transport system ATP-binding protein